MSEQGWREFHAAEGVDDWVVLHGGASWILADPAGNRVCICAWPDGSTLSAPVDPQHDA
ncbi:hypothetical protein ACXC9Q_39015 [Kribbella sp. CWNU-51]